MGAALEDGARASKIGFLDGTVEIVFFFSEPSPIRPRTKNYIHFSLNFGSDPATDKKQIEFVRTS